MTGSRFADKVVIVTGSSNGIGRATAILFASEGAKVVITGRNEQSLQTTFSKILETGGKEENILSLKGDLTDEEFHKKLIQSTIDKFGAIHVLVNNAGGGAPDNTLMINQSLTIYDYVLSLNTRAVVSLCQLAKPHLIASKGEIVNISSIASLPFGSVQLPYYAMSKAALDQLTRALAVELGPQGVRVNGVNPGIVETDIFAKQGMSNEQRDKMNQSVSKNKNVVPFQTFGKPKDIAEAIAFLADRKVSRFIVGHSLVIDGGSSIICPLLNFDFATATKA